MVAGVCKDWFTSYIKAMLLCNQVPIVQKMLADGYIVTGKTLEMATRSLDMNVLKLLLLHKPGPEEHSIGNNMIKVAVEIARFDALGWLFTCGVFSQDDKRHFANSIVKQGVLRDEPNALDFAHQMNYERVETFNPNLFKFMMRNKSYRVLCWACSLFSSRCDHIGSFVYKDIAENNDTKSLEIIVATGHLDAENPNHMNELREMLRTVLTSQQDQGVMCELLQSKGPPAFSTRGIKRRLGIE